MLGVGFSIWRYECLLRNERNWWSPLFFLLGLLTSLRRISQDTVRKTMPSTFLSLVNRVNRRVNEVELTSSNFAIASGFYNTAKDAVNDAIRRVNQHQFQWPFNHVTHPETMVAGTVRYPFQSNAKHVDFDTFRLRRDAALGNSTQYLTRIDYEEYVKYAIDSEYNTSDTSIRTTPRFVFQTPDLGFGVYPPPDKAYTLDYEYYLNPVELVSATDTSTIPSEFDHIVTDGAMEYVYSFRGDIEEATKYARKFEDEINEMRTIYINRQAHVKDTRRADGNKFRTHIRLP